MKTPLNAITTVVETLLRSRAKSSVKYLGEREIVRATNVHLDGRGNTTIILTLGRPNFAEREFIKLCKKAGQKFPIRAPQLKFKKVSKKKK